MNKLIASTALTSAMLMAVLPAMSQTAPEVVPETAPETAPEMAAAPDASNIYLPGVQDGVRASDFIGKRVYVTEAATAGMSTEAISQAGADWQDAGEISDLIISLSGDTEAVLVDFGGFLGIGEKTVALSLADLTMVPDAGSPDDYFIVFHGTQASLEAAPEFDPEMVFDATQDSSLVPEAGDGTMTTGAADDTAVTPAPAETTTPDATAEATPESTDGVAAPATGGVDLAAWAEEDLIGKPVYGPNDEHVGDIASVSMGADGMVDGAVVSVGGFLGIGDKNVVLQESELTVVEEADGTIYFRTAATQEQLEAMPAHAG